MEASWGQFRPWSLFQNSFNFPPAKRTWCRRPSGLNVVVDESYRRDMVVVFYLGFYQYKLHCRDGAERFTKYGELDRRSSIPGNWNETIRECIFRCRVAVRLVTQWPSVHAFTRETSGWNSKKDFFDFRDSDHNNRSIKKFHPYSSPCCDSPFLLFLPLLLLPVQYQV